MFEVTVMLENQSSPEMQYSNRLQQVFIQTWMCFTATECVSSHWVQRLTLIRQIARLVLDPAAVTLPNCVWWTFYVKGWLVLSSWLSTKSYDLSSKGKLCTHDVQHRKPERTHWVAKFVQKDCCIWMNLTEHHCQASFDTGLEFTQYIRTEKNSKEKTTSSIFWPAALCDSELRF